MILGLASAELSAQNKPANSGNKLLVFGGYHNQLSGFSNPRYVGSDKGDYTNTLAWYSGVEYQHQGFGSEYLDSFTVGGGAAFYLQNDFTPVNLYAVPSLGIPAQSFPTGTAAQGNFQLNVSGFAGINENWYAVELGLTVLMQGYNETTRQVYLADGTLGQAAGRGWVWGDNSLILPNFYVRLGPTNIPNITFEILREQYDPTYGSVLAYVRIPASKSFAFDLGGSFYSTYSFFLEPHYSWNGLNLNVRLGTTLNYNDPNFSRVGVFEGFFISSGLSYSW